MGERIRRVSLEELLWSELYPRKRTVCNGRGCIKGKGVEGGVSATLLETV